MEKRVTGIGGIFFKAKDPIAVKEWYHRHLGLKTDQWGCTFWWKDDAGNPCSTQWSVMQDNSDHFKPSEKNFMMNYRVENLEELLAVLRQEGVEILGDVEIAEEGKFGWILDPEGNKIELWEPNDKAFL